MTIQIPSIIEGDKLNHRQKIPTLPPMDTDSFPRITKETLLGCMDGQLGLHFDHIIIIDCRFRYEYDGGHIEGAVSLAPRFGSVVDTVVLDDLIPAKSNQGRTSICLYCEFSQYRAPLVAARIRSKDRQHDVERYPTLIYPDIYILDGGYNSFFKTYPNRCVPQAYIRMTDTAHQSVCEEELHRLRRATKSSKIWRSDF
jgi:M-phase inducer tyrosine phosphatase